MRVRRDFDKVYRTQEDPWSIGAADSARYNLYRSLVLRHSRPRRSLLDIGCGFGAFLARFQDDFERLVGVELSQDAIRKGRERFPFIEYVQGTAEQLPDAVGPLARYDTIIYSDVICYFDEAGKRRSLDWLGGHLADDGLAFIAAWCPGGKYLAHDELERLVEWHFKVEDRQVLDSGHSVFIARRKRRFVAVTVDYETWHPMPPGRRIDWEEDVFRPADRFLDLFKGLGVPLTLMAEMGEYFWLLENEPTTARRMEAQWSDAIRRGHDVQLHLHPSWLPELGVRRDGGDWSWDFSRAKAADYPGDLGELIGRCIAALKAAVVGADPGYRVTAFRAGAYQVQPFRRLHDALAANGILCDTSVYAGGISPERGYDFTLAYSRHQPYFANSCDPQLKAAPAERAIVELPIFTFRSGERWFLDGDEGRRFARRILEWHEWERSRFRSSESWRLGKALRARAADIYSRMKPCHRLLNRVLPRKLAHFLTAYGPERLAGNEYFVLTGHTKGAPDFGAISDNLRVLQDDGRYEFTTLSAMAAEARRELEDGSRKDPMEEGRYQVGREFRVVMGEARNTAQSRRLQMLIPLDRNTVLDLGCGSGDWSAWISDEYPWMRVTGVDCGLEFLRRARIRHPSRRISFLAGDFMALPFPAGCFDSVYADNSLEHSFDVDRTLAEVHRVLRDGGVLVAALPSDARNPGRICDNHTWKTAPPEVRMRLADSGFVDVRIEEIDTYRVLGLPPYPPSDDRMMYLTAWKRGRAAGREARAREVMDWVYRNLSPEKSHDGADAERILAAGYAFCMGYAIVLGEILRREGFPVRWITMVAKDHPRGKGPERIETHEALAVKIDGREATMDPMANTFIPHAVSEIFRRPELAVGKDAPDDRYVARGYHLYDTAFWYKRVVRYAVRSRIGEKHRFVEVR